MAQHIYQTSNPISQILLTLWYKLNPSQLRYNHQIVVLHILPDYLDVKFFGT